MSDPPTREKITRRARPSPELLERMKRHSDRPTRRIAAVNVEPAEDEAEVDEGWDQVPDPETSGPLPRE